MYRIGLVFACLVGAGGARAASPNPDDLAAPAEIQVRVRALIRQLGSEDFQVREHAQEQLAELGRHARPALVEGATASPDPEVRFRCGQLLPAAAALDLAARLDTFLADTKGEYEHRLPAWATFRATVRCEWAVFGRVVWSDRALDVAARQVFADAAATPANRHLLAAVDGSRIELADLVVARRQELTGPRGGDAAPARAATLADVTALLFAESRTGSQFIPRRSSIAYLLTESGFTSAVGWKDEKGRVYRAVAVAWLDSRNDPREMYQSLNIAAQLDLPDQACGLAARLLAMPGVTAAYRSRAASELALLGSKKHIPLLEKAMTDAGAVSTVRKVVPPVGGLPEALHEIQVRDLALAVSILLAEQKLEDYGFTDRYEGGTPADKRTYSYTRFYFADETARKRAFAKWADWRNAHADE